MKSSSNNTLFQNPEEVSITEAIQQLESKYIFRERKEIIQFLLVRPAIVSLLEQAYAKISQSFKLAPVNLEFIDDPEEAGNEHLAALVSIKKNTEQALNEFSLLQRSWWFPILRTIPPQERGLLSINLEF